MEKNEYKYEEVVTGADISKSDDARNTWKPVMRQCMISIGLWYLYLMQGLYLGAPTVLIAQVRREANSTDAVSDEMSSWLSSMQVISSLPAAIILPWLFYYLGRKYTYIIVSSLSFIGYFVFYYSTNLYHVLISQAFLGVSTGASNTFIPIVIVEYSSPKYRGIFLTFKSASTFWGIWIANAIGTYFYWKNIAIVSFVFSVYTLTAFAWPESPNWLAMKGRYSECSKSHRWLRGINKDSEKELANLIHVHKISKILPQLNDSDMSKISYFRTIWSTMTSRQFYKPGILCLILFAQYQFTGKLVISIYAIEVLKSLTQDESVAYKAMLILDGVTVFSMYMGCILSRYFKRRTLLLSLSSIGILLLYVMSFYTYLVSLSILQENHVLIIILLSAFSIVTGSGPMILASSIYGELVPLRYQISITTINGINVVIILSSLLKFSPFMFKTFKMHGTFLFFAICSSVIVSILYIYLPETKNKTVQEIDNYFNDQPPEQLQTLMLKRDIQ